MEAEEEEEEDIYCSIIIRERQLWPPARRYAGTGVVQLSRNQAGKFVIPNEVSCITGENCL